MERLDLGALAELPPSRHAEAVQWLTGLLLRGDPRAVEALLAVPGGREALAANAPRIPPSEALVEAARALGGPEAVGWIVSALRAPTDAARTAAWIELARRADAESVFVEQLRNAADLYVTAPAVSAFAEARRLRPYLDPPSPLHMLPHRLASPLRPVRAEAETDLLRIAAQSRDPRWDPRSLGTPGADEAALDAFRAAVFSRPDAIDPSKLPLHRPEVRRWAEDVLLARMHLDARIVTAAGRLGGARIRAALEDLGSFARGPLGKAVAQALGRAR